MSDLFVLSSPWEQGTAFDVYHLPILGETSHTSHNKYEESNFYVCHPLYTQNKDYNVS